MSTGKRKEPEAENGSEASGAEEAWTDEKKAFWAACPRLGQGIVDPRPAGSSPPWVTFIPCKPPLTSVKSDEFEEGDRSVQNLQIFPLVNLICKPFPESFSDSMQRCFLKGK